MARSAHDAEPADKTAAVWSWTERLTRRRFLAIGAGSSAALMLAGRTALVFAQTKSYAPGTTVKFWTQPYGDQEAFKALYDSLAADFKAATGVTVDVQQVPWADALTKWDLVMTSGDVPDAADVFYLQSRVLAGQGKWGPMDLTDVIAAGTLGDWSRFIDVAQTEAKYKDGTYQVPWRVDPRAFIYNSDFWPTVPTTLEEFETMGDAIVAAGGVDAASALPTLTQQVATQVGALWDVQVLSPDLTKSTLDDPRWAEAFAWAKRLVDKKVFNNPAVAPFDPAQFFNGKGYASVFGNNAGLKAQAAATAPQFADKIGASLIPIGPSGKNQSITSSAGFAVFQNSQVADAALDWITFLTNEKNGAELAQVAQQPSPDKTIQDADPDPFMKPFYEQSRISLGIDQPTAAWAELTAPDGPIDVLVKAVFSGEDIPGALAVAHGATNELIAQYE